MIVPTPKPLASEWEFGFKRDFPEGKLKWVRALLVPIGFARANVTVMRCIRIMCLPFVFGCICVDSGIYDHMTIREPKPLDGDKVPWILYGTSQSMLECFFYLLAAIWLSFAPDPPYETDIIQEMPLLASVTWCLHTIAIPNLTFALITYCEFLRPVQTYRESQFVSMVMVSIVMYFNLLLSNTPLLIRHLVWGLLALVSYTVLVLMYQVRTFVRNVSAC